MIISEAKLQARAFRLVAQRLRERKESYICNALEHCEIDSEINSHIYLFCKRLIRIALQGEYSVDEWLISYICNHGGFNNEYPKNMREYRAQWCESIANQLEGKPFATHYVEN